MVIVTKPILAMAGVLACLTVSAGSAGAMPHRQVANEEAGFKPGGHAHHHRHRVRPASAVDGGPSSGERDGDQAYRTHGDTSGFPGGNEFEPTAPFGGQAAVTAPFGTDAYKEQMNQRRYFCEYSSNRC